MASINAYLSAIQAHAEVIKQEIGTRNMDWGYIYSRADLIVHEIDQVHARLGTERITPEGDRLEVRVVPDKRKKK